MKEMFLVMRNIAWALLKGLFLFVWQLPQTLLGFSLFIIMRATGKVISSYAQHGVVRVYLKKVFFGGVSLGQFAFIDERYGEETMTHEAVGHGTQSRILGPLYLPTVGLVSLIKNILTRMRILDRKNYYRRWPESWAQSITGQGYDIT